MRDRWCYCDITRRWQANLHAADWLSASLSAAGVQPLIRITLGASRTGKERLPMNKVFLSHPHSAAKTAVSFAHWLEKVFGGRIIVICTSEPEHHIDPGHMVTTGIIEHIKSSSVVLVLVTPESLKLPW